MTRKDFTNDAILKRLAHTPAKCKKCGKDALQTKLELHHNDGDSSNDTWQNIVIYCRACHNDKHDTIPKHRDE